MKAPTEKQDQEARVEEALNFAPRIYPCEKCGWPVATGFCCTHCGDYDPSCKDGGNK